MVGIGLMVLKMRGYCVGVFLSFSITPPRKSTGDSARELHYTVEGTNTSSRRLFLRLQETLLPFLGAAGINFTHTLSCLNCTRNLSHNRNIIKWHAGGRWTVLITPLALICSYSSEMSMLSSSLSAAMAPVRWSLVMSSIRWSLLSKKSPLIADADP